MKNKTQLFFRFATILFILIPLLLSCDEIVPLSSNVDSSSSISSSETGKTSPVIHHISDEIKADVIKYTYNIPEEQYTEGIYNIVRRARQMAEIQWTPLTDIWSFEDEFVFPKHETVFGIPYGQPVYAKYVPWDATFDEFNDVTSNPNSIFYKERSNYNRPAPYYSLDCSGFVSWAWQLEKRSVTSYFDQYCYEAGTKVNDMHVGDCFLRTGDNAHTVLITGLKTKDGNVIWAEISESTLPKTRVTRYGEGEVLPLDVMKAKYLDDGYALMRPYFANATYTHNCFVPLDGECCKNCKTSVVRRDTEISLGEDRLNVKGFVLSDKEIVKFTYRIDDAFYGSETWDSGENTLNFRKNSGENNEILNTVPPHTELPVYEKTVLDGKTWGKVRFDGIIGWIWLDSSVYKSGTLVSGETTDAKVTIGALPENVPKYEKGKQSYDFSLSKDDFASENSVIVITAVFADNSICEAGRIKVEIQNNTSF